jgi:hypothetical protein
MTRTLCRDCIFGNFEDNKQTGCSLGRLEKFVELGTQVETGTDEESGKEYSVIVDRYCMMCRNQDWADRQKGDDLVQIAREECQIPYRAFIFYREDIKAFRRTVDSVLAQTVKPTHIVAIRKSDSEDRPTSLIKTLDKRDCVWRVRNFVQEYTDRECIDLTQAVNPEHYYVVFESGFEVPENHMEKINSLIHDDLVQLCCIYPEEGTNGFFAQSLVHQLYNGNKEINLEEKLLDDGFVDKTRKTTEICKTFQK